MGDLTSKLESVVVDKDNINHMSRKQGREAFKSYPAPFTEGEDKISPCRLPDLSKGVTHSLVSWRKHGRSERKRFN